MRMSPEGSSPPAGAPRDGKRGVMPANFRIVCLCGSAGALSAYVEILHALPVNTGMAFIVLTHRRTGSPCWLPQIIGRATRMRVIEVEDGTLLAPDQVFIMPPGTEMRTDGTTLRLVDRSDAHGWPDTFDVFLSSLAESTQGRATAVILSGMAADGSSALNAIRASGGTTFAQSDADYSSMPDCAMDTGKVDFSGPCNELSRHIAALDPGVGQPALNAFLPHVQTLAHGEVSGQT